MNYSFKFTMLKTTRRRHAVTYRLQSAHELDRLVTEGFDMSPPGYRTPDALNEPRLSLGDYSLTLDPAFDAFSLSGSAPGPLNILPRPFGRLSLSLGDFRLRLDNSLLRHRQILPKAIRELSVVEPPAALAKLPRGGGDFQVFGPLASEVVMRLVLEEGLDGLATEVNKEVLLDQTRDNRMSFWLVYENDGNPPFNPGSGSDQGPTAGLSMYVTFNDKREGLTKIGVTVIQMHTPRGFLAGQEFAPGSTYQTSPGPYSGIASVDFEVTTLRTDLVQVRILGRAGVDSTEWGKLVQDYIHKSVSGSPLFPWPRNGLRPFGELGVAALVTPRWVLSQGEVLGVNYTGKIEFDAKLVTGSHWTEATAGARVVLRTATVNTPLGPLSAEYSPFGAFVRGFMRYNDGREEGRFGVEGGAKSSFMLNIGRFGVGLEGIITMSTDPALQTDNAVGSQPLQSPLDGGPAGHHGLGRLLLKWDF
ncbi:MAG: hypothetical protein O3B95_12910 [Chloroflexi bacterium]|nr:hypothetical protein [Chloroflexota bacterium]